MFLRFISHPLFDSELIEEIIEYCDGSGAHIENPIDLTSAFLEFESERIHAQPTPLPYPIRIQTHLNENGLTWYFILWSNGDRSWESKYFIVSHPTLLSSYLNTIAELAIPS